MPFVSLRPRTLAAAVAALVAASGLSADPSFARAGLAVEDSDAPATRTPVAIDATQASARYIVRFAEQPLALYNTVALSKPSGGIGAIPSKVMKNGRTRLDVQSTQAKSYVQYVQAQQQQHVSDISAAIKQPLAVRYSMQHALNAIITDLTPAQVAIVMKVPGVVAVERDRPHPLSTDIGPGFIGAASVWWGTPAGQDTLFASGFDNPGFLGDGMVIGDIDTGYNSLSPSFQPTDGKGYTIQNPLGSGNFIGQCNLGSGASGISLAGCNDKVIGAYDEIDLTGAGAPFSAEDVQGHGSHTASTAAGDFRSASLSGYTPQIAGVAPHANLVVYYACSPDANVACSTSATTASVDQAIQDGIVDALNYSISGGTNPWNDSTSLAFLAAGDAGIFVAAAAGNTQLGGPNQDPGTANHAEPWVTTVGAGTHTGGAIGFVLNVNGAGAPGPVPLTPAASGTGLSAAVSNKAIVASTTYGTSGDACSAFSGSPFTGSIALISYTGVCGTNTMAGNAINAGADDVLIVANTDGPFLSGANRPKPVFTTGLTIGNALYTFISGHAGTTGSIPYPAGRLPQQPDVLADFSLLGPVDIDVIKPDVQAPGVNILAAFNNAVLSGPNKGPNNVALDNGTSMATPHTTGSGALLMGLHPDWTPAEAKSALMMTAKEVGLTKADATTPSDFFDRGSGRLQDFVAGKAGLLLDETGLNFSQADPGAGGKPATLNLASMQDLHCVNRCAFSRKFHSTQDHTVTWTASLAPGSDANVAVTISPSSFPATAHHDTAPVAFNVNSSALPSDGSFHFAEIVLTPNDALLTPLHLTMAVAVPPPTIAAAPNPLSITGIGNTSANATLTVFNIGGPTLNVTQSTTGAAPYVWSDQVSGDAFGYPSTKYTGLGAGDSDGFASDDFRITGNTPVDLTKILIPGFVINHTLSFFGPSMPVHWRIYASADDLPSSDPDTGGAAVWSYDATASSPGVSVVGKFGGDINLDLVAAGQHTALPAGHYWLVVYPELPCNDGGNGCTESWDWLNSNKGSGAPPVMISPQLGQPWSGTDPAAGAGFAMHLESAISCAQPSWLSTSGFPLAIAGDDAAPVTVTATGPLPGGAPTATAYVCLSSNDARGNPPPYILPVQVNASGAAPIPPTLAKAFAPASVSTGGDSTATVTLSNSDVSPATLTADLVDTLPSGLVATAASAATTCSGGAGASIAAGGGSVTLGSGAQIPANGSCTLSFTVTAASAATYTNTLAAGALQTSNGSNVAAGSASLTTADYVEGFNDITTLPGKGWILQNNSQPIGDTSWTQGPDVANDGPFDAQSGATLSFISANFANTADGTISNWLVSPPLTFHAGTSFTFYTRAAGGQFADRMEVRVCATGACSNVGTLATDVGDFSTLLLSINPTLSTNDDPTGANGYPVSAWAPFTLNSGSGMPSSGTGRVAFRYFVTNGGPDGTASNFVGIDSLTISDGSISAAPPIQPRGNGLTQPGAKPLGARH